MPLGAYARVNCPHNCTYRLLIARKDDPNIKDTYCVYTDFVERQISPPDLGINQTPDAIPHEKKARRDTPDRLRH